MLRQFKIIFQLLIIIPIISFSQSEWIELFNGKNLKGWEIKQGKADFKILSNGEIMASSILKSPSTYLGTKKHYDDFIL